METGWMLAPDDTAWGIEIRVYLDHRAEKFGKDFRV
jgi:hypothetical protein